jgi:hypothetical protein
MAKNTQSNRNIIQIHNLVKVADEKKRKPKRRRSPMIQPIEQPPLLATRIMQQLAPQVQPTPQQVFPGNAPDPDLVKSLRDAVSSQAAQMNEMRDARDRENEMYAAGINEILRGIGDVEERPLNRGQGRASNASSFPVEQEAQDVFENDEEPRIRVGRPRKYTPEEALEAKRRTAREYQANLKAAARAGGGNSNTPVVEAFPVFESDPEKWFVGQ